MFLVSKEGIVEHKEPFAEARELLQKDGYDYACFLYSDPLSPLFVDVKPEKVRLMGDWEGENFWFPEVQTCFLYPSESNVKMAHGSSTAHFSRLGWATEDMSWSENRMPEWQYAERIKGLLRFATKRRLLFFGTSADAGIRGERRRQQLTILGKLGFTLVSASFFPTATVKLIDSLEQNECFCVLGMDGLSIGCRRDSEVALSCTPYLRITHSSRTAPYVDPTGRAWVAFDEDGVKRAYAEMQASCSDGTMTKRLLQSRDVSLRMKDDWRKLQCLDSILYDSTFLSKMIDEMALDDMPMTEVIKEVLARVAPRVVTKPDQYVVFDSACDLMSSAYKVSPKAELIPNRPAITQSLVGTKSIPHGPLVSFVIPCMGRLTHLKQSLPSLVKQPLCEIVVVDWSCPEKCGDWADTFSLTRVVRVSGQKRFNLSKARNAGAREAKGEWLCFLDGDMIVAHDFVTKMAEKLKNDVFVSFGTLGIAGYAGMTTCRRADWEAIGGYDERMEGWGFEDTDFKDRLRARGLTNVGIDMSLATHIEHGNEDRTKNYDDKDQGASQKRNRELSEEKLKDNKKMVGFWSAAHSSWKGIVLFKEDGSFERYGHHDKGSWILDGKTLKLKWTHWSAEKLDETEDGRFLGMFLTLKKVDGGIDLGTPYFDLGGGLGDKLCALSAVRTYAKLNGKKVKVMNPELADVIEAYGDDAVTFGIGGKKMTCDNGPRNFGRNYLEAFNSCLDLPLGRLPALDLPLVGPHTGVDPGTYVVIQPFGNSRTNLPDETLQAIVDRCAEYKVVVAGLTDTPRRLVGCEYVLSQNAIDMLRLIRHAKAVFAPHSASAHIASAYRVPSMIWADLSAGHEMHLEYPGWDKEVVGLKTALSEMMATVDRTLQGRGPARIGFTTKVDGRLGNQMFQYAVPRILSEIEDVSYKFNIPEVKQRWPNLKFENKVGEDLAISFPRLSEDPFYHSYSSCVELVVKNREKIKSWFTVSDFGRRFLDDHGNPPVINVRGGDFLDVGFALGQTYYGEAIKLLSGKPIVVTDDIQHAKALFPNNEVFHTEDDFSVLAHAREVVSSYSTYCWWAVFLGDHDKVVAPDKTALFILTAGLLGWKKLNAVLGEEESALDENPDYIGTWKFDHERWSDMVTLDKDGTFSRKDAQWETGNWQVNDHGIILKWKNWGPETAEYKCGILVGDRFKATRPWRIKNPKISYCTTCKGRLWQLSQTYIKNIELAISEYKNVEFILLDYRSPDGLEEWVKENLKAYIGRGIVKYYKLLDDLPWHSPKSRNMAHRLAAGDILCNLDADNFLDKGFTKRLAVEVGQGYFVRLIGHASVGGRIALYKDDFFKVGGYDEFFAPMGHLDNDLDARLKAAGIRSIYLPFTTFPVGNSDEQRAEFCGGMTYQECCSTSKKKMDENVSLKRIKVNE